MPHLKEDEDAWNLVMEETSDPEVRIRLLGFRLSAVVREKERLERRIAKLEVAYNAGQTIFWIAPVLCAIVGLFWYNWSWISQPWSHHSEK